MKKIIFLAILIFGFNVKIFGDNKAENYLDFKEIIKKHYESFIYKSKKNQELAIKELIKKVEKEKFIESIKGAEKIKVLNIAEIELKENSWIFEKLNFIPIEIGNERISEGILSPEPKIPKDYYKLKTNVKFNNYKKIMNVKLKTIKYEIADKYEQFFPHYSNFSFEIEFFIFNIEGFEDKLSNEKIEEKKFCYRIAFIQDTSARNSFDRDIKVYGILEGIE